MILEIMHWAMFLSPDVEQGADNMTYFRKHRTGQGSASRAPPSR